MAKASARIRAKVKAVPSAAPGQIYAGEVVTVGAEISAALGRKEAVKRRIRRQKRLLYPPEPKTLNEINIPDEFQGNGDRNNEFYLIYDSGSKENAYLLFTRTVASLVYGR